MTRASTHRRPTWIGIVHGSSCCSRLRIPQRPLGCRGVLPPRLLAGSLKHPPPLCWDHPLGHMQHLCSLRGPHRPSSPWTGRCSGAAQRRLVRHGTVLGHEPNSEGLGLHKGIDGAPAAEAFARCCRPRWGQHGLRAPILRLPPSRHASNGDPPAAAGGCQQWSGNWTQKRDYQGLATCARVSKMSPFCAPPLPLQGSLFKVCPSI